MKKRAFLMFFVLLLVINISYSQDTDNLEEGFNYLQNRMEDSNWNRAVDEVSYTILALSQNDQYNISGGVTKLVSKQKRDGSYNNRVIDTSLATLALYSQGYNVSKSIDWILNKEKKAITQGYWYIQILNSYEGEDAVCEISVSDSNPVFFNVNASGVSCDSDGNGDGWGNWFDLQRCGNFNIGKYEIIDLDCSSLGNVDMSLIYQRDSNYYLLDQKDNSNAWRDLEIENAYFGDFEKTAIATWVLNQIGEGDKIHTTTFLMSNSRENNNLDIAYLHLITQDSSYKSLLETTQNEFSGSWDNNVFTTSIASLSLIDTSSEARNKAVEWLINKQNTRETSNNYGSWNGDIIDTAVSLYSIYYSGTNPDQIVDLPCNHDEICNFDESTFSCPDDCPPPQGNECTSEDDCDSDFDCNLENEICNLDSCICEDIQDQRNCLTDNECPNENDICVNGLCLNRPSTDECSFPTDECESNTQCINTNQECNLISCTCEDFISSECDSNNPCDSGYNCLVGKCKPIHGYCENDGDCQDEEVCDLEQNICVQSNGGFPWWIITVIVILIAGLLIFYFSKHFKKKPKIKPEPTNQQRPPQKPVMVPKFKSSKTDPNLKKIQRQPQRKNYYDDQLEKELDKSLKKAKDLIKDEKK